MHIDLGIRTENGENFSEGGVGFSVWIEGMPRNQPLRVSEHPGLVGGLHYWNSSVTVTGPGEGVGVGGGYPQEAIFDGTVQIGDGEKPTITFCLQANLCASPGESMRLSGALTADSHPAD